MASVVRKPATWSPHSVAASEDDEERALELWRRHLVLDVEGDHGAGARPAPDHVAVDIQ